jgi:hypothetical protein
MRFVSFAATCALAAALLAGCASQLQGLAVPGQMPAGFPKPHRRIHLDVAHPDVKKVAIWVSDMYDNYIVGQTENGAKTVAVIDTANSNCTYPGDIKVDGSQNLWAACENAGSASNGSVAEWSASGVATATYQTGCPSAGGGCDGVFTTLVTSSASDSNHVFAGLNNFDGYLCNPSCASAYGAGVEWWPANTPSATPTLIQLPYGDPVENLEYMDEDGDGNLWLDFFGCNGSQCGQGLGEITSPTSPSWKFTEIENPGTYSCPGGVYVSDHGKTLNVTDCKTRKISVYALPLSPGGSPTERLGPTRTNSLGQGLPVGGGYNEADSKMAIADLYGWLNMGTVSTNKWKAVRALDFEAAGAAYTPSDKQIIDAEAQR